MSLSVATPETLGLSPGSRMPTSGWQSTHPGSRQSTAPNPVAILAYAQLAVSEYAERDKTIDRIRALRFMQVDPAIPPAFALTPTKVKAPFLHDQLNRL